MIYSLTDASLQAASLKYEELHFLLSPIVFTEIKFYEADQTVDHIRC